MVTPGLWLSVVPAFPLMRWDELRRLARIEESSLSMHTRAAVSNSSVGPRCGRPESGVGTTPAALRLSRLHGPAAVAGRRGPT